MYGELASLEGQLAPDRTFELSMQSTVTALFVSDRLGDTVSGRLSKVLGRAMRNLVARKPTNISWSGFGAVSLPGVCTALAMLPAG